MSLILKTFEKNFHQKHFLYSVSLEIILEVSSFQIKIQQFAINHPSFNVTVKYLMRFIYSGK